MKNYQNIFKVLPLACLLLEPKDGNFFIRDANDRYSEVTGMSKQELIGNIIPDVFPENPEQLGNNWKEIHESLNKVLITGKSDKIMNLRYDLLIPGLHEFEERYWQVENIPIVEDTSGNVNYILYSTLDKTSEVMDRRKAEEFQREFI